MDSIYDFRFGNNWQIESSSREMTTDAGLVVSIQLKPKEELGQGSEQLPITVFKRVADDGFVQVSNQIVEIQKTSSFGIRPKTIPRLWLAKESVSFTVFSTLPNAEVNECSIVALGPSASSELVGHTPKPGRLCRFTFQGINGSLLNADKIEFKIRLSNGVEGIAEVSIANDERE